MRLRRITASVGPAFTTMPLVPDASTPAIECPPSMVIAFVIVTAPNPPGSSTSMVPPAAVLLMAPANVLHGAVREHGLASSPTPETQVRVACAAANEGNRTTTHAAAQWIARILIPLHLPGVMP